MTLPPDHFDGEHQKEIQRLTVEKHDLLHRLEGLVDDVADLERRNEALRDEALAAHRARLDAL